jgi:hypothetical protein
MARLNEILKTIDGLSLKDLEKINEFVLEKHQTLREVKRASVKYRFIDKDAVQFPLKGGRTRTGTIEHINAKYAWVKRDNYRTHAMVTLNLLEPVA